MPTLWVCEAAPDPAPGACEHAWFLLPDRVPVPLSAAPFNELSHLELEALRAYAANRV